MSLSKYKTTHCQKLVDHMGTGLSFASFGAVVDASESTLFDWVQRHDAFAKAKALGEIKSLHFWEKMGVMAAAGRIKGFQPAVYIFTLKCRFRKYGYRDIAPEEPVRSVDKGEQVKALLIHMEHVAQERAQWKSQSSQPSPSGLLSPSESSIKESAD